MKVRIVIFLILLAFIVVILYLGTFNLYIPDDRRDFFINLFTEIIGIGVTVFLVDFLIRKGREKNITKINERASSWIRFTIDRFMFRILKKFNLVDNNDIGDALDFSGAFQKFKEFVSVDCKDSFAGKLLPLNQESIEFTNKLIDEFMASFKGIGEKLKEIKPYPNPDILKAISEDCPYNLGVIGSQNMTKEKILNTFQKISPEEKKKSESFSKILLEISSETVAQKIIDIFEILITIRNKANDNMLSYDVN